MPVRQRSPSSQGSAAAASFQPPTTMPQDPTNDASAYRTMRSRNPDGSSTVYRVHESVLHGAAGVAPAPAPPGRYYGGGGGIPPPPGLAPNATYAPYAPSSYTPYNGPTSYSHYDGGMHYPQQQQQQRQQPHVVFVRGDDEADDDWEDEVPDGHNGDGESQLVPFSSSSSSSSSVMSYEPEERTSRRPWCARNSLPCILSGMILAIGFVTGYVFLVEAIVDHSRASRVAALHGTLPPSASSYPNSGLRAMTTPPPSTSRQQFVPPSAGGQNAPLAQQLDLEPRYYVVDQVLRPLGVGEVPPGAMPGQSSSSSSLASSSSSTRPEEGSRSIVAAAGGGGGSGDPSGRVEDTATSSLLAPSVGVVRDRDGSDEPVRRNLF